APEAKVQKSAAPKKLRSPGVVGATVAAQQLKISQNQLLVFTEQLAHLLEAGMTLDEGLSILEKRLQQPRLQQLTHSLHQALVEGRSFSQALREFRRIFPPVYVNLVAAGDASGAVPAVLLRLVLVAALLAGWRAFVRTDEGRIAWDRFRLHLPAYGRIQRHGYYAQFSPTLGTLVENGIPLLRSLDLVSEIAGNRFLETKM